MKKIFILLNVIFLGLVLNSCYNNAKKTATTDTTTTSTAADTVLVSDMSNSSSKTMNDAVDGLTDSTGASVAYNVMPDSFNQVTAFDRAMDFIGNINILSSPLYAVPAPMGMEFDPANWSNAAATEFYIYKTMTASMKTGSNWQEDSKMLLHWSGLDGTKTGKDKITTGTVQEQAIISKKSTNTVNGKYVTVVGTGSALSHTFPVALAQTGNIAHVLTITNANSTTKAYTLSISVQRTGYTTTGTTDTIVFQHNVTTPSGPISVTTDFTAQTRTMNGTVAVQHVLAGVTMTSTYNNFVYSTATNNPVSGSITVTFTGNKTGSGTITFTNGTGTFSFTFDGKTLSGPIDL